MFRFICAMVISSVFFVNPLCAFSMGREGNPYYVNGVKWQKVHYQDGKNSLSAALPNEPRSVLMSNKCVLYSRFGKSDYEIQICTSSAFNLPNNREECIKIFESTTDQITLLTSDQESIRYLFRVDCFDSFKNSVKGVTLVIGTENALYIARVDGTDLSLSDDFFASIVIDK